MDFAAELRRRERLQLVLAACTVVALGGLVGGFAFRSAGGLGLSGLGCSAAGVVTEKLERAGWRMPIIDMQDGDRTGPPQPTRLNHVCYFFGVIMLLIAAAFAMH
jgi:hypothetical protein